MNEDLMAQLLRNYRYDPETGEMFKRVGHETNHGYSRISLGRGRFVQAHRAAWALTHRVWPNGVIDHVNGDGKDNRLCNLRDVSNSVNQQNERKARKNSKSGLLGASWSKAMERWTARIHYAGKHHFLGYFDTPEEAHAAYISAKRISHAGCTI